MFNWFVCFVFSFSIFVNKYVCVCVWVMVKRPYKSWLRLFLFHFYGAWKFQLYVNRRCFQPFLSRYYYRSPFVCLAIYFFLAKFTFKFSNVYELSFVASKIIFSAIALRWWHYMDHIHMKINEISGFIIIKINFEYLESNLGYIHKAWCMFLLLRKGKKTTQCLLDVRVLFVFVLKESTTKKRLEMDLKANFLS